MVRCELEDKRAGLLGLFGEEGNSGEVHGVLKVGFRYVRMRKDIVRMQVT